MVVDQRAKKLIKTGWIWWRKGLVVVVMMHRGSGYRAELDGAA